MCATECRAREALRRIGLVMNRLGLTLHPAKTRLVDLRRGKESFVFLGCTIRKKRSIQRNPRCHFMQRWPSPKATKKLRDRVRELTSARQSGKDVKQIIAELTPVLRGWGNYFRTGNADREFKSVDAYVIEKLRRWQHRRGGQRIAKRPGFTWRSVGGHGPAQIARHREVPRASHTKKIIVKPCAGKRHARFERGTWKRAGVSQHRAKSYQRPETASTVPRAALRRRDHPPLRSLVFAILAHLSRPGGDHGGARPVR